jgi:hypothetical protein
MEITDLLAQMGGVQSVARDLGVSESQARQGAEALLPAVLGGFKKQAQQQPSGLDGLGGLLGQLGGAGLLDNVLGAQPTDVSRGNDVLGQIFGSKDVSRAVAADASSRAGLDVGVLKKMLPILAMMVAGFMSKQGGDSRSSSGGGLGSLIGGLLGGGRGRGATGAGALASMLDVDGDGNPLDDILGMLGQ